MLWETLLRIALFLGLEVLVYVVFVRPRILTWGATAAEARMPLLGDELAPSISATRAIAIDAPQARVWQWVTQLGADRAGFFSYVFLERLLGYEMQEPETVTDFPGIEVGRVLPTSLDEAKSFIQYDFRVQAVEPGQAFVVKGWGTFMLSPLDAAHTRLIVRTHGQALPTLLSKLEEFFSVPAHYIMERRMLMGIKARAESGTQPSATADNLWLLGLVLSALGLAVLVLFGSDVPGMVLAVGYGMAWLWTLLILAPRPVFSLALCVIVAATLVWRL